MSLLRLRHDIVGPETIADRGTTYAGSETTHKMQKIRADRAYGPEIGMSSFRISLREIYESKLRSALYETIAPRKNF